MNEHFQRHVGPRGDFLDIVERQFAGQDDSLDAEAADKLDAARFGERHLRRAVDRQLGSQPMHEPRQPQILHDHGIGPRRRNHRDKPRHLGQFVGEDQRVERDVAAHIAPMQIIHHLRQFVGRKIRRPMPGIEIRQPKINRIRPAGHRGAQRLPIARRSQQLGLRAYPRTIRGEGDRHILLRGLRKMSQSPMVLG